MDASRVLKTQSDEGKIQPWRFQQLSQPAKAGSYYGRRSDKRRLGKKQGKEEEKKNNRTRTRGRERERMRAHPYPAGHTATDRTPRSLFFRVFLFAHVSFAPLPQLNFDMKGGAEEGELNCDYDMM